jgi:hypothetical protein
MKDRDQFGMPEQPEAYPGRGRVLRVKEGFNPNSSSLGSVIFSIPAALVAAPVLLAGVAALLAARLARKGKEAGQAPPAKPTAAPAGKKDAEESRS